MQRRSDAAGAYMPYFGMLRTVASGRQRKRAVHWIVYFVPLVFFISKEKKQCFQLF